MTYIPVYIKLQEGTNAANPQEPDFRRSLKRTHLQLEVFRVEIDLFDVGFDKPQEFIEVA